MEIAEDTFLKVSHKIELFSAIGIEFNLVQDNESKSCYGVLRGLYFQKAPHEQSKLVRCVNGKVIDVAVNLRKSSSTFGNVAATKLSQKIRDSNLHPKNAHTAS